MRIAVVGGGPGGLYFAALAKQLGAGHEITVWERNALTTPSASAWSSPTRRWAASSTPTRRSTRRWRREFASWDDIDIHFRGQVITSGGHGFAAMSRRRLLEILQAALPRARRAAALQHPGAARRGARREHDLVVAADGSTRASARRTPRRSGPSVETRRCRYMWLGTTRCSTRSRSWSARRAYGVMQIHAYPYDATGSTFIVEMHDDVWRAAGFAALATSRPRARGVGREVDRAGARAVR